MARTPQQLDRDQQAKLSAVASTATVRREVDDKYAGAVVDAAAAGIPVLQIAQAAGTTHSTMAAYIRRHRTRQEQDAMSTKTKTKIDEQERARREHDARAIRHSTVMEGGSVIAETQALQDAYARGEITEEQMMAAFRDRYGLTSSE